MNDCHQKLESWLSELSLRQGLNLKADEHGYCYLQANKETNLVIMGPANAEKFVISAKLIDLNAYRDEHILKNSLELNLYQEETRGASLALDSQYNTLTLCISRDYRDMEFDEFYNTLENITQLSQDLKEKILQSEGADENHDISFKTQGMLRI